MRCFNAIGLSTHFSQSEVLEGHDRSIATKINRPRFFQNNKNDGVYPEQRRAQAVPPNPACLQEIGSALRKPKVIKMAVAKKTFLAGSDCICFLLFGNHIFLNAGWDTAIAIKFHGERALTLSHAAQVGRIAKSFG